MSETRKAAASSGIRFRLGGKDWTIPWAVVSAAMVGAALGIVMSRRQADQDDLRSLLPFSPMAICFYFWIVLSVYWSLEARKASAVKSSESRSSRALHVTLTTGAQLLAFWFYPGWPRLASPPFVFPRVLPAWPFLAPLGVAVQAGGLLLALWARRSLGRHWSGEVTVKEDHELVRSGPYRRIRHPIYTGAIAMYIGPALVSGRLQGVLSLALVAIAYARKIRQEERVLSAEFGSAYDDYCRESWVVFPGLI